MKLIKNLYTCLALGVMALVGFATQSCSDNIPASSYYTFTGEMMSDYLQNHEDYSKFTQIVNRASSSTRGINLMDLISCYGQFTCFAPTNEAVDVYLKENGYASVDDIPADLCDTIARTHLVNGRVYNTADLVGLTNLPSVNMNDRYIQVKEVMITQELDGSRADDSDSPVEEDPADKVLLDTIATSFLLNGTGEIIYNMANDSVENGIIQPVNRLIASSNKTVVDLLKENPDVSVFYNAVELTGLGLYIRNHIKDLSWNSDKYESVSVYTGGQWDYCHIPENKNYGYTVFTCPNDVLAEKYNITDMQSFYDYARGIYGGEDLDVNDPANLPKLQDRKSPLRRLIGYNILNAKGMYEALTTICTIETTTINPTEWYSTLDSLTLLKVERLTVSRFIGRGPNDVRNDLYLNRGDMSRNCYIPGVHVNRLVEGGYENDGSNGVYYTTDGLANYGEDTKDAIFNTRMRIDLYSMFPELMTNNIRDGRTNNHIADSNNPDKTVTSPNYWFPNGYLDNVKVNDDGIFLFQSQHNTYWSYEGDEFNLTSKVGAYDITFNLPSVPTGHYQIRLGFCAMATRGICQFYLDGEPKGIPFDNRNTNMVERSGWFALNSKTGEELEIAKKNMHNLGWYHGPKGVFCVNGEGHLDTETNLSKSYFCNNGGGGYTIRYVLCEADLEETVQHTVRIKSIWAPENAVVMIDYFELVPKSVYSVEGEGRAEDDL